MDHVTEGIMVREFQNKVGRLQGMAGRYCRQPFPGIPFCCGLWMYAINTGLLLLKDCSFGSFI